ncbi:hypothetical protein [Lichenifustis flavocetrariae]|uniref:Uncharacterized protein n=1 Tax=Lichenifustis flavocetrariae TaxID=2949735 RepID=A0AA41Z4M4_9HYPH|nr:hypothetical protein [Lichenifustis flavocetrariae]MCW6510225.1 hypothetical protein [Lichenifustis flavocetrariae]
MPDQTNLTTVSGEIRDIFAHRFVLQTPDGPMLADLGPRGAERVSLKRGQTVSLSGEMKPSELKVTTFTSDGVTVAIEHGKPGDKEHGKDHGPVDLASILASLRAAGHESVGEPRRKPKHVEVLARAPDGSLIEHHVEFDGHIRKSKPIEADSEKWAVELA